MDDTITNPQPQSIILDTCILQYMGNNRIKQELSDYLTDLFSRGFTFSISEVSCHELIEGASKEQEVEIIKILNTLNRFPIEFPTLMASGRLATLYREYLKTEKQTLDISLADKIIASTAILTGSLVLTANVNDFPRPFFQEAEEKLIMFKHKDKTQMHVLQILKPNLAVIERRFEDRH